MIIKSLKNLLRPIWHRTPWWLHKKFKILEENYREIDFLIKNKFLEEVKGVIHVGANTGQERFFYKLLGLKVIWIEPIPDTFKTLNKNIKNIPNQTGLNELITDHDGKLYDFHITDNDGLSSSLFELKMHKEMWPNIKKKKTIKLKSKTLETLINEENISISDFQALIIDTQGSELLVLQGCKKVLNKFKYIKTEAADFESYENCCLLKDINDFLINYGFQEMNRYSTGENDEIGQYFDILFKKIS